MLRPAGGTRINTFLACFALSGEVSLIQTDHVSSEEPACSTRAGSATPAPPLTKLMSPVVTPSISGLCLLFLVFPYDALKWCLCSRLNRVFAAPFEVVPVLGA